MIVTVRLLCLVTLIAITAAVHAQEAPAGDTQSPPAAADEPEPGTPPSSSTPAPANASPDTKVSVQGAPLSPQELAAALATINGLLAEVKAGDTAPGYHLLSPDARKTETEEQWNTLFSELTAKAGKREASVFGFALKTDSLPNAAPGHYVIVGLNSTFEKAKLAETIILLKGDDEYRIAGYHFQNRAGAQESGSESDAESEKGGNEGTQ